MTPEEYEDVRQEVLGVCREKVAAMMLRLSIPTGHGDTIDDLLSELETSILQLRDINKRLCHDYNTMLVENARIRNAAHASPQPQPDDMAQAHSIVKKYIQLGVRFVVGKDVHAEWMKNDIAGAIRTAHQAGVREGLELAANEFPGVGAAIRALKP